MNTEHIWNEFENSLRSFVRTKIQNQEDVEDILQDVLIKVIKNLSSLKAETSVKSWLYQITRNTIIDFYRKNGTSQSVEFIEDGHTKIDDESEDIKDRISKCIRPFIEGLDEPDRILLTEIEIKGQSQKDYALSNDIKYSTLKSQVKRSREKLRTSLEKCCKFSYDHQGNLLDSNTKSGGCSNC